MASELQFFQALKSRYGKGDYALLPQVRNSTGFQTRTRTADAIAVSLWPSRGIDVHGFEFKDSRADWLKELKEPAKAEEIGRYCGYWWLMVSDASIVRDGELPSAWGLLTLEGDKAKVVTKAPRREAQPPTWTFMAAVMRAAAESISPEADVERRIKDAVNAVRDEVWKGFDKELEVQTARLRKTLDTITAHVKEFEEASGVKVDAPWRGEGETKRVGEAVKFVVDGGLDRYTERLLYIAMECGEIKDKIERTVGTREARAKP